MHVLEVTDYLDMWKTEQDISALSEGELITTADLSMALERLETLLGGSIQPRYLERSVRTNVRGEGSNILNIVVRWDK